MRIQKEGVYKGEGEAHYTEGVKDNKALTKTNGGYGVSLVW